jgi:tetratricopeptide (TPR) repeat protein
VPGECGAISAVSGPIAEAISANNELLGFYQQISLPDGEQWWAATAMGIAFLQGTIADTADPSGAFAERYPNAKAWRGTHAWALAEAGRLDEARAVIDRHGLDHPERFPTDEFITASWAYVAFLALLVDAPDLGAATEHLLRPYEHLWINLQIFTVGPVAWLLAIAVAAQGRYAEAEELFDRSDRLLAERGLDLHRNLHLLYHAVALSRSATADHRLRARELARLGVAATARPELDRLRQRFEQLLASLPVA